MAKTSRPKHPRANCTGPNRPMAKLSEHHHTQIHRKLHQRTYTTFRNHSSTKRQFNSTGWVILSLILFNIYSPRTQQNITHNWDSDKQHNTTHDHTPKILGLTLDPKLTYNRHIDLAATNARKTINILKSPHLDKVGQTKEPILATYKAITRPVLEYASTIWSPNASEPNIDKLQIVQNAALRIATGCTHDTNTHWVYKMFQRLQPPMVELAVL